MVCFLCILVKIRVMKKILLSTIAVILFCFSLAAQQGNATLKTSSRLFKEKDDLTSVIMIIPRDSVASVLDFDDTYLKVDYNGNIGYIFSRDAKYSATVVTEAPEIQPEIKSAPAAPPTKQSVRYEYLKGKYGREMADRLLARKIWKGMNSGMVKDSWGSALKVTREVAGNLIKEEWLYRSTWLYFENSILVDWGPVRQ